MLFTVVVDHLGVTNSYLRPKSFHQADTSGILSRFHTCQRLQSPSKTLNPTKQRHRSAGNKCHRPMTEHNLRETAFN